MTSKIGVVIGQVGTPLSLETREVRRYLKEFLSDERIIDLPRSRWYPILHSFVLPFRPRMVAKHFGEIWTSEGSPLLKISMAQRDGIQARLGDHFQVELGLAYSEPGLQAAISNLEQAGIRKIIVLPMFPQYANSTTASIYDATMFAALGRKAQKRMPKKKFSPTLRFVHPFYDDPEYIQVLANSVMRQLAEIPHDYDRIILSFHGLPKRFVDEGDPYIEQCHRTGELLAKELGWDSGTIEVAFQSRFGRTEWVKPYLQPRLEKLHSDGVKAPVIVSPGFTTDCLETLHELGIGGRELFEQGGGDPERYRTLACLNDDPDWLDYAADLIRSNAAGW
ncbi:MAG: ferrochelatase [Actinomycetales bacterium]|nr:ferrochelatase [Actinomycetales bacterium]